MGTGNAATGSKGYALTAVRLADSWQLGQVQRELERFASVVGRENVIAGTDCGLGGRVHPEIAWAKFRSMAEGAYALGATKSEVATRTVFPAALSGIIASFILALSRAIGETMAVTIAAGMTPKLTLNPFTSIETMTAYIVQVSMGETPYGTIEYRTIFAVGLVLFLITLSLNLASLAILKRFREVYE